MDKKKVVRSPFRWTGSKKKLLNEMLESFDDKKSIYVEPFLGSGIVLLNVINQKKYDKYYVNDININVITFYEEVKNNHRALLNNIKRIVQEYNECQSLSSKEAFYYMKRKEYNEVSLVDSDKSSLFWFLMKTCFNGVYRVNSHNEFNVPFGKKDQINIDEDYFDLINVLLKNVCFSCLPYEEFINGLIDKIDMNDCFIYCDPPYLPETSSTINHTLYTKDKFLHVDFIEYLKKVEHIYNASLMISMSSSSYGNLLYGSGYNVTALSEIIRTVNPKKIIKSKEIAYTNYPVIIKKKGLISF